MPTSPAQPVRPKALPPSRVPTPEVRLGQVLVAGVRQVSPVELALDDLPSADALLLVDGRDAAVVDLDVGQGLQAGRLLEQGKELRGLGLGLQHLEQGADGEDGVELVVVDAVGCELVDAFCDLGSCEHDADRNTLVLRVRGG